MDESIFLILLKILWLLMVFFIKLHVLIHLNNGVVERKNRHLFETTRTILIHGDVPQRFWCDVVLSACYLINRMSSSVLDNKILHSILFPHDRLHSLPPKVFGSICFVHNFSPGLDKLSPKSQKCVFLGFTRSQKGYKCFSPSLNRYFISADVTFSESSIYLKSCPSPSISSSNSVNIPLVVPSAPNDSPPPRTLQVYSHRQTSHRPSADSIMVPTPHSPPAPTVEPPTVEPDLPIVICKGIHSTRNPSPHYTALCYHRLSQPFYTCLSCISYVSIPKSVGDALAHPGWR